MNLGCAVKAVIASTWQYLVIVCMHITHAQARSNWTFPLSVDMKWTKKNKTVCLEQDVFQI